MFSKFVLALFVALTEVQAQRRQFPVPSRLVYGPTVPIAKAAAEAALGYAASMPSGIVANSPINYGARVSKFSALSHSSSIPTNSYSHGAYPASLAVSSARVAAPVVAAPRYAALIYRPAQYAAPAIAAPAFAPKFAAPYLHNAASNPAFGPQSYSFGYQSVDEHGNRQSRQEEGDANNFKKGSYSFTDVYGISRRVDYVADHGGFRATINTNEPGTAPSAPAAALYSKSVVHRKA